MSSDRIPWENDKLGRQQDAEHLSTYLLRRFCLSREHDGHGTFVLNINAEWGFGKTYFLVNFKEELSSKNFPVIYFNAWESDFSEDPLVAFISEVDSQLKPFLRRSPKALRCLDNAISSAQKLIKPSLPVLLSILTKQLTGLSQAQLINLIEKEFLITEELKVDTDVAENVVSTVISRAAEKALVEHDSKKASIAYFRQNLGKLVKQMEKLETVKLPIFIFVDELDRCRPSYAIELLECIKHLFGVDGIYFVIATDSKQLTHSIKAVYGNTFDSTRYLKRFFDQEYSFLPPDNLKFADYLFEANHLNDQEKLFLPLQGIENPAPIFFSMCSSFFGLSLRDQEQICNFLNTLYLVYPGEYIHIGYALFLIILKHKFVEEFEQYLNVNKTKDRIAIISDVCNRKFVDRRIVYKTVMWNNRQGNPESLSIQSIFKEYEVLASSNMQDILHGNSNDNLFQDIIRNLQYTHQNTESVRLNPLGHDLDSYPIMILRAGQLS